VLAAERRIFELELAQRRAIEEQESAARAQAIEEQDAARAQAASAREAEAAAGRAQVRRGGGLPPLSICEHIPCCRGAWCYRAGVLTSERAAGRPRQLPSARRQRKVRRPLRPFWRQF
jgi:hypothetical protein